MGIQDVALLGLRIVVGGIFVAHGLRKLGWLGGDGYAGFVASIRRRGYRPAPLWAFAAVCAELVGGVLVIGGALMPIGGALLVAQAATILWIVRGRGFWHDQGGTEYPLMLTTAALAVTWLGAGAISIDAAAGVSWPPEVAVAATLATLSGVVVSLAARQAPS